MTPLSDALTAAQRSALAALEKAFVAERINGEELALMLDACGISDPIDVAFLATSLTVLREWGVSAPTMTERVTEAQKDEPASDKQLAFIKRLCNDAARAVPSCSLTKAQASEVIDQLQAGTYDPARWGDVPF